jgi:DNA replication protein DnaC
MCECRRKIVRKQRLACIPPKFSDVALETLEARPTVHAAQAELVPFIKANPGRSYFFCGKFGTGKSMFMWALYRHAVMRDTAGLVACTLSGLLAEYKSLMQAEIDRLDRRDRPRPKVLAGDLRQNHTRYSIFIDDIDKAKPTEYAAEQLFEVANAIYDFRHQVVVTTNLTVARLRQHFERADDRFGGAIVRRLLDGAKICEMF